MVDLPQTTRDSSRSDSSPLPATCPSLICKLPIRRRLTVLLLTPCVVVLLLAGMALLTFQLRLFRRGFTSDLQSVARMVGANSTSAISSNNPLAAAEVLACLQAKDHIVGAALFLPDGTTFASYGAHPVPFVQSATSGILFEDEVARITEPVRLDGRQIATLILVGDYRQVYASLVRLIGWILLLVVIAGAAVAVLLSSWLQKLVSEPILRLTRTAQKIADEHDYSVRAPQESSREFEVLTRSFNHMLVRIHQQDQAVQRSQDKLKALIDSIDGIVWERTADSHAFTFVSRKSEPLLGYPLDAWVADARFWHDHLHPDDAAATLATWQRLIATGEPYTLEYRLLTAGGSPVWIRESGSILFEAGKPVAIRGIFLDVSQQKSDATELNRLHRQLLEASRFAGMAEVATGILHNVGNVLNSASVSANVVLDRLKESRVANLHRATLMLSQHLGELPHFLTEDPKGKVLPDYLVALSNQLQEERSEMMREVTLLGQNVAHITEIVAMQQNYAKVSGAYEILDPEDLLEDALRVNAAAFERHGIEVVREIAPALPRVLVDRHKVLQILINLLRNAKYAMDAARSSDKRLRLKIEPGPGQMVSIRVRDNGVGIAPENLTRIFQHGFTTKRDGHGFGLHSGAIAAQEMKGKLVAHSDGLGTGAEFSLQLPMANPCPANQPRNPPVLASAATLNGGPNRALPATLNPLPLQA